MALKFGTSGVRGLVTEMTDLECYLYTKAYLTYLKKASSADSIVLGGDFRSSTPRIMRAIAFAIEEAGLSLINAGLVPTPAITSYAMKRGMGSIMVTGSHIPDDRNGIKFNLPWGEVLKADEQQISAFVTTIRGDSVGHQAFDADGALIQPPELGEPVATVTDEYIQRYLNYFPEGALSGLRLVLYQHSTVGREILKSIFEGLGAEVIPVGWSDSFVPVDTEAVSEPDRLSAWVKEHDADALVTADGDCDRPLVVDEQGTVIRGDVLGIIVGSYLNADTVATPVSCNTAVEKCGHFSTVARTRIGSPYVIEAMKEALSAGAERVIGYEANGGFLTGTDITSDESGKTLTALPTRDAALPIIAILRQSKVSGTPLSKLVADLPARYTCSGLLREIPNADGKALVADLEADGPALAEALLGDQFGEIIEWDYTDGARMTLAGNDVLHFRPSGNAPEFRIYSEASSVQAAQQLNDNAALVVRRYFEANATEVKAQRRENIQLMIDAPLQGAGMDVIIVSTTSPKDEAWWQDRLTATRGQITNKDAVIVAVHEDWDGGAGNGLGTLYAMHLAQQKALDLFDFDILDALAKGASIALYHTAGRGTRLAPLPASEGNNKPAVKLPQLVNVGDALEPVTVLESVIKQTGIYAAPRRGRLSVFWGDQVFVPSTVPAYTPTHHADIVVRLGTMPTADEWTARGLNKYGLIAVGPTGDASQVEKISHATAQQLIDDSVINVEGGIGVSIGSFSMSAALTQAMLAEFAPELDAKSGKLDTDPHFWMPLTLPPATYREVMATKGVTAEQADSHHQRMTDFKKVFLQSNPEMGMFGAMDVGEYGYWWDYGLLHLYHKNLLLATRSTEEGNAVRHFFGLENRRASSKIDSSVEVDDQSIVIGCELEAGSVKNSVLVGVMAGDIEVNDSAVLSAAAPIVNADEAILYNASSDAELIVDKRGVLVQIEVDTEGEPITMRTGLDRNGSDDWDVRLPGNPLTYGELYDLNQQESN